MDVELGLLAWRGAMDVEPSRRVAGPALPPRHHPGPAAHRLSLQPSRRNLLRIKLTLKFSLRA